MWTISNPKFERVYFYGGQVHMATTIYEQHFLRLRDALCGDVKALLLDREGDLEAWMGTEEAAEDFIILYKRLFEEYFHELVGDDMEERIWFMSMNAIYLVRGHVIARRGGPIEDLLDLVDAFVGAQLDDRMSWCPELCA